MSIICCHGSHILVLLYFRWRWRTLSAAPPTQSTVWRRCSRCRWSPTPRLAFRRPWCEGVRIQDSSRTDPELTPSRDICVSDGRGVSVVWSAACSGAQICQRTAACTAEASARLRPCLLATLHLAMHSMLQRWACQGGQPFSLCLNQLHCRGRWLGSTACCCCLCSSFLRLQSMLGMPGCVCTAFGIIEHSLKCKPVILCQLYGFLSHLPPSLQIVWKKRRYRATLVT